jgi:ferredoxin
MAAKACFGASLCEKATFDVFTLQQNDLYTEEALAKMALVRKNKYSHYFTLLKTKYQNTQYQRQVLAECADYSLFSGK